MMPSTRRLAIQGFLFICLSGANWPALAAIGSFQFTFGEVKVLGTKGEERVAQKGSSLDEGETVVTGTTGTAQLKMVDGGVLAVRPDTQLKFDSYRFSGREDGTERGFMSLVKGGFRSITGFIGRANRANYRVTTPTATVGIRGTDHETFYIPDPPVGRLALVASVGPLVSLGPLASAGAVAQSGGVAPSGGATPPMPSSSNDPGTYVKVNVGSAFIRTQVAVTNILPNQVGFARAANQSPQLLPRVPDLFRAAPPPTRSRSNRR